MKFFLKKTLPLHLLFILSMLFMQKTNAQNTETIGVPFTGSKGITVSAADIEARSRIADAKPKTPQVMYEPNIERSMMNESIDSLNTAKRPNTSSNNLLRSTSAVQNIHSNFSGIRFNELLVWPPSGTGDVGTTQICMLSHGRLKFFTRNTVCQAAQITPQTTSDSVLATPAYNVDLNIFFNPVADTNILYVSEPHVRFDRLTRRWFITGFTNKNQSNSIVIAVSSGPTVTYLSSFTFFYIVPTQLPPVPANYVNGVFENLSLGLDKNALYIGGLVFSSFGYGTKEGSSLIVVRKSSILGAGPIVATGFHNINVNMFNPLGVHNTDPNATDGYFIAPNFSETSPFHFYKVSNPGLVPTLSADLRITPPSYVGAGDQAGILGSYQLSNGNYYPKLLDGLLNRMFCATLIKNKITGLSSLWTAHAITVDSAGAPTFVPPPYTNEFNPKRRNASRFYEITNLSSALPTIHQFGTLFDTARVNPRGFWVPSITGTGQGHAVMGCSTSGAANYIDVAVTGRYSTDSLGTLQPFQLATASNSFYEQAGAFSLLRWGDFSQTVLDPLDDMTAWTFQEYCNSYRSYAVRAVQLKAPPPATPVAIGTIGCVVGKVVSINIVGIPTDNAGFFDPGIDAGGPGYNRLNVTSTGAVTVSNIIFNSPTSITVTLNFIYATPGSTQTLTITNPDCQSVTTTYTLPAICPYTYTFTGTGNWSKSNNWVGGNIPPTVLTGTDEIIINPIAGGECVMSIPTQTIAAGSKITILSTKKFRVLGNLIIQ
jgi:hypothetical protein